MKIYRAPLILTITLITLGSVSAKFEWPSECTADIATANCEGKTGKEMRTCMKDATLSTDCFAALKTLAGQRRPAAGKDRQKTDTDGEASQRRPPFEWPTECDFDVVAACPEKTGSELRACVNEAMTLQSDENRETCKAAIKAAKAEAKADKSVNRIKGKNRLKGFLCSKWEAMTAEQQAQVKAAVTVDIADSLSIDAIAVDDVTLSCTTTRGERRLLAAAEVEVAYTVAGTDVSSTETTLNSLTLSQTSAVVGASVSADAANVEVENQATANPASAASTLTACVALTMSAVVLQLAF